MDLGCLAEFIRTSTVSPTERVIVDLYLFGSKPPPADTVWGIAASHGWKVSVMKRSSITGGEKMVDTLMLSHISEVVLLSVVKGVIAIMSGDIDFFPAVDQALRFGWNVEVYGFDGSTWNACCNK